MPGPDTVWKVKSGGKLTPSSPVVLTWTNDKGLTFDRRISVDDHFMFTVTDTVENGGNAPVSLVPYGRITRFYKPAGPLHLHPA